MLEVCEFLALLFAFRFQYHRMHESSKDFAFFEFAIGHADGKLNRDASITILKK